MNWFKNNLEDIAELAVWVDLDTDASDEEIDNLTVDDVSGGHINKALTKTVLYTGATFKSTEELDATADVILESTDDDEDHSEFIEKALKAGLKRTDENSFTIPANTEITITEYTTENGLYDFGAYGFEINGHEELGTFHMEIWSAEENESLEGWCEFLGVSDKVEEYLENIREVIRDQRDEDY